MSRELFIGLDGEMSGNDHSREHYGKLPHRLIQIGVAFNATETFSATIRWPEGTFDWEPEAAAVHNIPIEDVTERHYLTDSTSHVIDGTDWELEMEDRAAGVDWRLSTWLREKFEARGVNGRNGVPVGFNVAAFDMPFVRRDLPLTASFFGYRAVDLNSLCFMMGHANEKWTKLTGRTKERLGWKAWKTRAKAHAAEVLGHDNSHDAGYDAQQAILAFEWLSEQIAKVT